MNRYTWKQISKAIKIAYSRATPDSWNVPHHYESSARAEIKLALKRKEFNKKKPPLKTRLRKGL